MSRIRMKKLLVRVLSKRFGLEKNELYYISHQVMMEHACAYKKRVKKE